MSFVKHSYTWVIFDGKIYLWLWIKAPHRLTPATGEDRTMRHCITNETKYNGIYIIN